MAQGPVAERVTRVRASMPSAESLSPTPLRDPAWGRALSALRRIRDAPQLTPLWRALRWLWPAALVAYPAYCLYQLGWQQIWRSLPASPWFYLLIVAAFFVQPAADWLIYRKLWRTRRPLPLSVLLRKRFMNDAVLDYSGEAYLFAWARKHSGLSERRLLHSIKDTNLLSAVAGMTTLCVLLAALSITDHWSLPLISDLAGWIVFLAVALPLLAGLGYTLMRRRLTVLDGDQIAFAFAVHAGRDVVAQALTVVLWSLALPAVSLAVWLNFLAFKLLIARLSFLPRKDLTFLAAGIGLAGSMDIPQAIAPVLVVIAASELSLNMLLLALPFRGPRKPAPAAGAQSASR